jgi:hypothetical protein
MKWTVIFDEEFEPEFETFSAGVQDELYGSGIHREVRTRKLPGRTLIP